MSVHICVYLVNWDDFQDRVYHSAASEVLDEVEEQPFTNGSARTPSDFLEVFDDFERAWKGDSRLYFKEVFHTIFWFCGGHGNQNMELEEGENEDSDLFGVDTALKPETVKDLVGISRRMNLEECRLFYESRVKNHHRFGSFDEWKSYGEEWLSILRRAAEQDMGFIIANFG